MVINGITINFAADYIINENDLRKDIEDAYEKYLEEHPQTDQSSDVDVTMSMHLGDDE